MGEQRSFKVGDVVAWADVPDGALVKDDGGSFMNRQADGGRVVGYGPIWESREQMHEADGLPPWHWTDGVNNGLVTIVALGLSGTESADTLRSLAS